MKYYVPKQKYSSSSIFLAVRDTGLITLYHKDNHQRIYKLGDTFYHVVRDDLRRAYDEVQEEEAARLLL